MGAQHSIARPIIRVAMRAGSVGVLRQWFQMTGTQPCAAALSKMRTQAAAFRTPARGGTSMYALPRVVSTVHPVPMGRQRLFSRTVGSSFRKPRRIGLRAVPFRGRFGFVARGSVDQRSCLPAMDMSKSTT